MLNAPAPVQRTVPVPESAPAPAAQGAADAQNAARVQNGVPPYAAVMLEELEQHQLQQQAETAARHLEELQRRLAQSRGERAEETGGHQRWWQEYVQAQQAQRPLRPNFIDPQLIRQQVDWLSRSL